MASSTTAQAGQLQVCSTEEQAEVVAPWELCLRQISTGAFKGNMEYVSLGDILVYRDCWSQRGLATCALPADYLMVGAGIKPANGIDWCGKNLNAQTLAVAPPNTESTFIMPPQTSYLAVLLPERCLNTLFGDDKTNNLPTSLHHYGCHPAHGEQLIARLNRLIEDCLENPGSLEDTVQCKALESSLIDDLSELGFGSENLPPLTSLSARRKTLKRALEYGESIRNKISVPQFAAQLAVNRRSLELIFREFLGITPRQYLMYRRLHGVHEELRRLSPGLTYVTEVANYWGFTELGRFSRDYRNLFGELPSETFNRATTRAPRQFIDLLH